MPVTHRSSNPPLAEIPPRPASGELLGRGKGPGPRLSVARAWGHFKAVLRWIDDGWAGDVLGGIALVAMCILLFGFLPVWEVMLLP